MPALPDGWVSRVDRLSVSGSGKMRVLAGPYGTAGGASNTVFIGDAPYSGYTLHAIRDLTYIESIPGGHGPRHVFILVGPGVPVDAAGTEYSLPGTAVEDYFVSQEPFNSTWSQQYTVAWSIGPMILAARYACQTPDSEGPALSYRHGALSHAWFADENTAVAVSCAGYSGAFHPYTELTLIGSYVGGLSFGGYISFENCYHSSQEDEGEISELALGGAIVDTAGLDGALGNPDLYGPMKGFGGGLCRLSLLYNHKPTGVMWGYGVDGMAWAQPPVQVTYDVRISKYGKSVWGGAKLGDNWLSIERRNGAGQLEQPYFPDGIATPFQQSYVVPMTPWCEDQGLKPGIMALGASFQLQPDWMEEQDPPLPAGDAFVPIQGPLPNPPEIEPEGFSDTYAAITLDLAPEIDVHRPDGALLSSFTTPDPECLEITEASAETAFLVKQAGGTAVRHFTTRWRDYFTKGGPSWTYYTCRTTKHVEGEEDIYSWNTYALMDLRFRCPVACVLTMTVDWVKTSVSDNYLTDDDERRDEWSWTAVPGSSSYLVVLDGKPDEDQTVRINLLFPEEGGPCYLGRVDTVTLDGFVPMPDGSPATVVLKGMKLVSSVEEEGEHEGEYRPYYVKIAPGPPVRRGPYCYVGIAHDGSSVTMEIPDTAYKWDETTACGGNLRYCEPWTGAKSGLTLDWQVDIGTIALYLNKIEGISAIYNEAASDAALSDEFTKLGPENADWLVPLYPVREDDTPPTSPRPGVPWALQARPMCRTLGITNGIPWTIRVDHALMGGIEAVVHEDGAPVAAGTEVQACYVDEDGVEHTDPVASGVTDACGYVVVAPVPANGSRVYQLRR